MPAMYGANVSQLEDLATSFRSAADRLDAARLSIFQRIQLRMWGGPVAVRFRSDWDSRYNRMVHSAAEGLRSAAEELAQNADEQNKASLPGTTLAGTDHWINHLPKIRESRAVSRSRANPQYHDNDDFWDLFLSGSRNPPEKWSKNCGYASIAYEMRRRGYDVTAAPDTNGDGYAELASAFHDPDTGQPRDWTVTGDEETTTAAMKDFGPGARAMVVVQWKDGGGGHCFIVENVGGVVHYTDPQTGEIDGPVTDHFKRAEPGSVRLLRVDDQEPTMNDMVVANND